MSAEDNEGDLATQYVLARRQRPDLDVDELVKYIVSKFSNDELLQYAEEAPPWEPEVTDRRELAVGYVRNFVLAMEADPDDNQA